MQTLQNSNSQARNLTLFSRSGKEHTRKERFRQWYAIETRRYVRRVFLFSFPFGSRLTFRVAPNRGLGDRVGWRRAAAAGMMRSHLNMGPGARGSHDKFVIRRPKGISIESEEEALSSSSTPTRTASGEGAHRDKQTRSDVLRWSASSEHFKVAPAADARALHQRRPIAVLEGEIRMLTTPSGLAQSHLARFAWCPRQSRACRPVVRLHVHI
jgi:hypothetical protein